MALVRENVDLGARQTSNAGDCWCGAFRFRRRRAPFVRLGSENGPLSRRSVEVRLRRLKLKYSAMATRVERCYRAVVEEVKTVGSVVEEYQQRLAMEVAVLAVPVMGFPLHSHLHHG